jgi:uncharacterized metal-binding protein YceD (DUF177 family)
MSAVPEFSRPVPVDSLGGTPRALAVAADEGERAALARRFGLVAVGRLSAEARLSRGGETVIAEGRLSATVTQSCIAGGAPVEQAVEEEFRIEFRPHPEAAPEDEVELSEAEMDVVFYGGAAIDLGEAMAETLALSLDPYPRSAEAEAALREAGVKGEEEAGPFAALAALKDGLGK